MKNGLMQLNSILDNFSKHWKNKVKIEKKYIDITECFRNKKTGKFKAPLSFGNLNKNKVHAYVVYGAPFLNKYAREKDGKLVYIKGKFKMRDIDNDIRALACLCVKRMLNVSFHEIYDAISGHKETKEIQGFRDWALRKVIRKIKSNHSKFNPKKDSAFIFAGEKEPIILKIKLNKLWLKQILEKGSKSLNTITKKEARLIKEVFGKKLFNPMALSYMYGRELHSRNTLIFKEKI